MKDHDNDFEESMDGLMDSDDISVDPHAHEVVLTASEIVASNAEVMSDHIRQAEQQVVISRKLGVTDAER